MLKPLVPNFHPDPLACLKEIAEKTGPREAKTDCTVVPAALNTYLQRNFRK